MLLDASIRFVNLGIEIENLPKNIKIGSFEIAFYGIIIGIGMMLAVMLVMNEAKRTGQNVDNYYDLAIFTIIFGIIGARAYYVIFEWEQYKGDLLSILNIREGGLGIYGGIIIGAITVFICSRVKKIKFMQVADTAILGVLVGQILGRWGNFFNREAFGGYTDNLLAMQIKLDEVGGVISEEVAKNIKIVEGIEYIQVHPTFLYESLCNLIILLFMLWYRKHKKYEGELLSIYMIGYGIARFFIESLRTDQLILPVVNFPASQLVSIIIIIAGVIFEVYERFIKEVVNKEEV